MQSRKRNDSAKKLRSGGRQKSVVAAWIVVAPLFLFYAADSNAQTVAHEGPPAHSLPMPDWQKAVGGSREFEVASVKHSGPGMRPKGMDMSTIYGPPPNGGLFSANAPLIAYIVFAYRIVDSSEIGRLRDELPKWALAYTSMFSIEARSEGTPTKDQLRLMLQSLLEERFKLAMHTEIRQLPVYALALEKPGEPGPQLQPHLENKPCVARPDSLPPGPGGASSRPFYCGMDEWETEDGQTHLRMLDLTMDDAAGILSGVAALAGGTDRRPFLNQTGLKGHFDLNLEFMLPGDDQTPDSPLNGGGQNGGGQNGGGPTAIGAMKKQLGLKLIKQTGPVHVLLLDHVEMPALN